MTKDTLTDNLWMHRNVEIVKIGEGDFRYQMTQDEPYLSAATLDDAEMAIDDILADREQPSLEDMPESEPQPDDCPEDMPREDMDGDHDSAMASAGFGTDEDYGYFGGGED